MAINTQFPKLNAELQIHCLTQRHETGTLDLRRWVLKNHLTASKIHSTSFKIIPRKSENVLRDSAWRLQPLHARRQWQGTKEPLEGGTKQKVDKVEIFVPVIRGPNLCDFGRRAIIEELGKERETPGDNRLLFYSSKKVNGDDDENSETKRNLRKNMKNHKNNHFTCQCLCFFSAVFLPHLPFFSTSWILIGKGPNAWSSPPRHRKISTFCSPWPPPGMRRGLDRFGEGD